MSDWFYKAVRAIGSHAFWANATPLVLGIEHIPKAGAFLLASTHASPYDVPLLIRHVPRSLDFVSITEVFESPVLAWFYGSMNAFPLDRHKPDAPTVRTILGRLQRGRPVAMFPEGGIRRGQASVVHSKKFRSGIGRVQALACVPLVPVVVINSETYSRPSAWLPLRRTRYAIAFGAPIQPGGSPESAEALLLEAWVSLYEAAAKLLPKHSRMM
jgi:1-acyl-sn-glycerol-3-phosphate acyltransferase